MQMYRVVPITKRELLQMMIRSLDRGHTLAYTDWASTYLLYLITLEHVADVLTLQTYIQLQQGKGVLTLLSKKRS